MSRCHIDVDVAVNIVNQALRLCACVLLCCSLERDLIEIQLFGISQVSKHDWLVTQQRVSAAHSFIVKPAQSDCLGNVSTADK